MAIYTLLAGADSLLGADGVGDVFLVPAPGRLGAADTLRGGTGAVVDILYVQAAMTLAAADFANVRGIDRIIVTTAAGAGIALADAMAASGDLPAFVVNGGLGGDTVSGAAVVAKALNMAGGGGDDSLVGGGGADLLAPGTGLDTVAGGAGNDTFAAALADLGAGDLLDGGQGALDVLRLTAAGGTLRDATLLGFERIQLDAALTTALVYRLAVETAASAAAPLTVAGAGGADALVASAVGSAVVLLGEGGADRLVGGQAGDLLRGGALNDSLHGYLGDDTLEGGEGDDRIVGGVGNDLLRGEAGNDSIVGGLGDDTIEAGPGTDTLDGGLGNDWVRFATAVHSVGDRAIDESGAADVLEVAGTTAVVFGAGASLVALGFERILLGGGADVLVVDEDMGDNAGAGVMTIEGGGGNDRLDGSAYVALTAPLRFLLRGDAGNDTLRGGAGADTLDAGSGWLRGSGGAGDDLVIVAPSALGLSFIDGGAGSRDVLRLSESGSVGSGDLIGVTGIEVIELSDEGNSLVIRPALVTAVSGAFTVRGGAGDDLVDTALVPAVTGFARVELGAGDDTFVGGLADPDVYAGSGNDRILLGGGTNVAFFGAGELSALDVVTAPLGSDDDYLAVTLVAGRTLGAAAFDGVTGIDHFHFESAAGAAVRLASDLVSQSGQPSVEVSLGGIADIVVDGRGTGPIRFLIGNGGAPLIMAGSGADTIEAYSGNGETVVGGDGGDRIQLSGGSANLNAYAVIVSEFDGTGDINTTTSTAAADRVYGTSDPGAQNYIAAEWQALGLNSNSRNYLAAGENIDFSYGANILNTANEIAGNAFGSLTAVRATVGARMGAGTIGDRTILVIGGADEAEFGVYLFEDGDNNTTIDVADTLRLLAIGTGDVPISGSGRGFALVDLDLF